MLMTLSREKSFFFHYTTSMDYSGIKQITPFNSRFQQAIITLPIPDVHDYK